MLILKAFALTQVPIDFYDIPSKMVRVDYIAGFADRVYSGEKLKKSDVQAFNMDSDTKKEISSFLFNHSDNLPFYYL